MKREGQLVVCKVSTPSPMRSASSVSSAITLKIDTLRLEGVYQQSLMGFSQLVLGAKNIPPVEQIIVSFGLNSFSMRVKDGQMSMIEGSSHSVKKHKFDSCSLALPPQGDGNYRITY
jgi:hypothetical protein